MKEDEQLVASACLLENLHKIRKYIGSLWKAYLRKSIDLHAAAIATNTAVEIARRLQENYDNALPEHATFKKCATRHFVRACRRAGIDPLAREQPGDAYNLDAYAIADRVFLNSYLILVDLSHYRETNMVTWVDDLVPESRDTSSEWPQKSPKDKLLDDDFVLYRAFTGLTALAALDRSIEDEFVRGVRDMAPGKPVPLWLAFAAQMYLDIQHALGPDLERPYQEMHKAGRFIKANLDQTIAFHERLSSNPLNHQFCARIRKHMKVTSDLVYAILIDDYVDTMINGSLTERRSSFNFSQQNPVMCGLYLFGVRYLVQQSSISWVKTWCTIMHRTHLYNALKIQRLTGRWEDMEVLFKLQGGDRIFMGSAPGSIADCNKRFSLCRGVSIANRASDRRDDGRKKKNFSGKNRRNLEDYIPFASLIAGRYIQYENYSLSTDLAAVELKIRQMRGEKSSKDSPVASVDAAPNRITSDCTTKATKNTSEQSFTVSYLLDGMAEAIQSEGLHLTFDYLRLHRTCCNILITLEAEISHEFDDIPPFDTSNGHHLLHSGDLVAVILMSAAATEAAWQEILRDDAKYIDETLSDVAESVNEMVEGKAGSIGIEIIRKTFGYE